MEVQNSGLTSTSTQIVPTKGLSERKKKGKMNSVVKWMTMGGQWDDNGRNGGQWETMGGDLAYLKGMKECEWKHLQQQSQQHKTVQCSVTCVKYKIHKTLHTWTRYTMNRFDEYLVLTVGVLSILESGAPIREGPRAEDSSQGMEVWTWESRR